MPGSPLASRAGRRQAAHTEGSCSGVGTAAVLSALEKSLSCAPPPSFDLFWRQIRLFVQDFQALCLFVHVEVTKRPAGHEQGPPRSSAMNFGESGRATRQPAPADGLRSTPRARRKRRGRPRIRTARYWREYYARKQREWRAAHPDWRQRRKEGKVKRRKKPGSDS